MLCCCTLEVLHRAVDLLVEAGLDQWSLLCLWLLGLSGSLTTGGGVSVDGESVIMYDGG